jgi:hypothetical protein
MQQVRGKGQREKRKQVFEHAFINIHYVLQKESGCTTETDYAEQTSRVLFLKNLDGSESNFLCR